LAADGLRLPHDQLDVRPIVGNVLKRRTGTVEDSLANLGLTPPAPCGLGRGGHRLASLCAVAEKLRVWPLGDRHQPG